MIANGELCQVQVFFMSISDLSFSCATYLYSAHFPPRFGTVEPSSFVHGGDGVSAASQVGLIVTSRQQGGNFRCVKQRQSRKMPPFKCRRSL